MKKEYKFLFTFLIISSILYLLISIFYNKNFPIIGTSNVALIANDILRYIGINTTILNEDMIYFPNDIGLKIVLECTGTYEMIILSSMILAYPITGNITKIIKDKIFGIILGLVVIYILNMARLLTISFVLIYHIDSFNFVDRYLWQISLVVFISITYMIWLKLISKKSTSGIKQSNSSS